MGYSLQGCKESDTTKHARTLMKDSHPVVVLWGGSRRNEEISLSFLPLISCQRSPLAKPTRSQRARNILMWSTQDSHWVHRAGWRGKEKITDTRSIPSSPALFTCRAQMFPQHRVGICKCICPRKKKEQSHPFFPQNDCSISPWILAVWVQTEETSLPSACWPLKAHSLGSEPGRNLWL